MDFIEMYGAKSITASSWNLFFSKNWHCLTNKIKNEKAKTFCKKVAELKGIDLLANLKLMCHSSNK